MDDINEILDFNDETITLDETSFSCELKALCKCKVFLKKVSEENQRRLAMYEDGLEQLTEIAGRHGADRPHVPYDSPLVNYCTNFTEHEKDEIVNFLKQRDPSLNIKTTEELMQFDFVHEICRINDSDAKSISA